MTKDMMLKALSEFMGSKNDTNMSLNVYKSFGSDVPVKDYLLRRAFGSWSRVLSAMNYRYPVQVKVVKETPKPAPKKVVKKKVEKKDGK